MFVAFLIMVAVALPLGLAIWFAPLAVMLDGLKASHSLRASLSAVVRNMPAFTVYGIVIGIIASALFLTAAAIGMGIPGATEFTFWMLIAVAHDHRLRELSRHLRGAADRGIVTRLRPGPGPKSAWTCASGA